MRSLHALAALSLALLPCSVRAAPSVAEAKGQKTYVFVIPSGNDTAEALSGKVEGYFNEVLREAKNVRLLDPAKVVGGATPEAVKSRLVGAQDSLKEGMALMRKGQIEDAHIKLSKAYGLFEADLAYVESDEWSKTLALLGACNKMRGDEAGAKRLLLDLAIFDPEYAFDLGELKLDKSVAGLWAAARKEAVTLPRGSASLYSTPAGAAVFLDGRFRGYTPLSVERLAAGPHVLQIDRPGFRTFGARIEIKASEDHVERPQLDPTRDQQKMRVAVKDILEELRSGPGTKTLRVGAQFKLDRGVFVRASSADGQNEVVVHVVDFHRKKLLATRQDSFEGGEFSDYESQIKRLAKAVLDDADRAGSRAQSAADPLDNVDGMEDWDGESRGEAGREEFDDPSPSRGKKKAGGGDPLDGVSGTEDW